VAHEEKILQEELRVFEQHRLEWLPSHCGEFAAIVGAKIIGFYPDFESGFQGGPSGRRTTQQLSCEANLG
jgi:hypothetical protein